MSLQRPLLCLAISASLLAAGCSSSTADDAPAQAAAQAAAATPADADAFVERLNDEAMRDFPELASAQWLASTYINSDSQLIASKANERYLAQLGRNIEEAKRFEGLELKPETARTLHLLKLATSMPAPKDPEKLSELAGLTTKMEGIYGSGTYCKDAGSEENCRQLGELEDVLREGDEAMVKVLEVSRDGKIRLSRRAAMEEHAAKNS